MNAEALIGTVLGTCTLQKLVGQGGMGAVFLAQQSRPKRQVAVKILLPMTPLNPNQLAAFLERFRRETDAAASLEHPNITPVHEYGEQDGLAYLVMPYVSGGTLRDEMEREGPLELAKVVLYLDQVAAALDFAHAHGVIHRDIKPANILMTPEGRLFLTDFGLVKIVAEGKVPQVRLTGAGAPVGTPDYMAPEQVIGEEIDARADLYSLGVVLYQMVTGTTPFQGETPMQIAAQHLQIPPPSPQMLRPDLPVAAEQVMLRALAKRPSDRYMRAQDLANAFRAALVGTGIQLNLSSPYSGVMSAVTSSRPAAPGDVFDAAQQTTGQATVLNGLTKDGGAENGRGIGTGMWPAAAKGGDNGWGKLTGTIPTVTSGTLSASHAGGGLLSRTGKFPQVGTGLLAAAAESATSTPATGALSSLTTRTLTGALFTPGQSENANTVKLTGPVKVVQVPVAGQPGRFLTGLLPIAPLPSIQEQNKKKRLRPWMKIGILVAVIVLVLMGTVGTVLLVRSRPSPMMGQPKTVVDPKIAVAVQATAAAQANIILYDRLDRNINTWPTKPANVYAFKDGAYHITDRGNNGRATVLQSSTFTDLKMAYTLTMQEINGQDDNTNNSLGMIFRFSQQQKGNKSVTTFYSFEVVNTKNPQYQFWKYDNSQANPWTNIWQGNAGNEFHQGHGAKASNVFRVLMDNNNFTFTVNAKAVKTSQDNALKTGMIGMIVNLDGTEIAFKELLLTHN